MAKRREQPIEPNADDFDWLFSIAPFRIPTYQRAYDWDTEEVKDFAHDVRALADRRLESKRSRHFFGALISVLHKPEYYHEVVDGQQRLATTILTLNELHRELQEVALDADCSGKPDTASAARKAATIVQNRLKDDNGPRLTMSKRDQHFFADLLAGNAKKPKRQDEQSHRRLWGAHEVLREELFDPLIEGAGTPAQRLERLQALNRAVLQDGYLVHLFTEDKRQAYRLFSVLNDRGRPLSDGALLRTHTLAILEEYPAEQQAAEADWDSILREGDTFVDDFLAAYYVSYAGVRASKGEMFDQFRDRFLFDEVTSESEAQQLRQKIRALREEMEIFGCIRVGDWPFDEPKTRAWDRDRLKRLVIAMSHNLAHPLLLAVAREAREESLRQLVLMLEPFVFRYINVVGASPGRLAGVYYEHAAKVRTSGKLDRNGLQKTLKQMLRDYARDDIFVPSLRDQLRYAKLAPRRRLIKHFLTTLEDYEAWFTAGATGKRQIKNKTSVFDLDQVNIEHVYPQNPKATDANLEEVKHALGNLLPLDDRDGLTAGNDAFSEKRKVYTKSHFSLTRRVAPWRTWDTAAVQKNFDDYAERAKKVFVVE